MVSSASLADALGASEWAEQAQLDSIVRCAIECYRKKPGGEVISSLDALRFCSRLDANARDCTQLVHEVFSHREQEHEGAAANSSSSPADTSVVGGGLAPEPTSPSLAPRPPQGSGLMSAVDEALVAGTAAVGGVLEMGTTNVVENAEANPSMDRT